MLLASIRFKTYALKYSAIGYERNGKNYFWVSCIQVAFLYLAMFSCIFCDYICFLSTLNTSLPYIFFLFDLILYVLSTISQLQRDGPSWVEPVLS